jgi:hypothetical protein
MRRLNALDSVMTKDRLCFWLALTLLISQGYVLQDVAGSIFYFITLQPSTLVSKPPVTLQNGTDNVSFIYTNSTSAKISINATESPITKNYTLVINNTDGSQSWEVRLEVYDYNISSTLNATIYLHDNSTYEKQIVISNGTITNSSGNYLNLTISSVVYIKIENLAESVDGFSYLNTYLRIRKPNKTTYILYIITFEFN